LVSLFRLACGAYGEAVNLRVRLVRARPSPWQLPGALHFEGVSLNCSCSSACLPHRCAWLLRARSSNHTVEDGQPHHQVPRAVGRDIDQAVPLTGRQDGRNCGRYLPLREVSNVPRAPKVAIIWRSTVAKSTAPRAAISAQFLIRVWQLSPGTTSAGMELIVDYQAQPDLPHGQAPGP
jgi:hypothetical protein